MVINQENFRHFLTMFDTKYDIPLRHEKAEIILNEGLYNLKLSSIDQIAARRCLALIYDVKADWQKGIDFLTENQTILNKYEKPLLEKAVNSETAQEEKYYIIKNIVRHYDIFGRLQFRMMRYIQSIDMFNKSLGIVYKFTEGSIKCIEADIKSNLLASQYQLAMVTRVASEDDLMETDVVRSSNLRRKIQFIISYLGAIKKVLELERQIDETSNEWQELQRGKSNLIHSLAIACRLLGGKKIPEILLTIIPKDLLEILSKQSGCIISTQLELLELVISIHNKALEINELLHDEYRKAQTLLNKAIALLDAKEYQQSRSILLKIISDSKWRRGHWIAHERLAKLADMEKNTKETMYHLKAVEEDKQSYSDVELILYLKTTVANRLKNDGCSQKAYEIFKEIIDVGETIRERFGFPHYRRRVINYYKSALEEVISYCFCRRKLEEGMEYLERRASRELLDLYLLYGSDISETFVPSQQITERIFEIKSSIGRMLDISLRDKDRAVRSSDFLYYLSPNDQNDFFALIGRLDFLYEERWESNKRYKDITHSQALVAKLKDIISSLDDDTVIIQYFIPLDPSIEYGHVTAINRHGVVTTQPIRIIDNLRKCLHTEEPWTYECLTTLYLTLFSPIKDTVDSLKPKRLCFVADGSLAKFPLHCLYNKDTRKFLWELYSDTYFTQAPSATIFKILKENANRVQIQYPHKIFVVVDNRVDQKGEGSEISKIFTDNAKILRSDCLQATNLGKILNGSNVQTFHFIGHGMFLEMAPMLGLLYLGNREFLTAADLFTEKIEGQNAVGPKLVFLNSCQTGKTTPRYNEMLGLIRSFLLLGASTVIATLWNVESSDATYFSTNFYKNLLKTNSPCDAFKYAIEIQSASPSALRTHGNLGYSFPYVMYGLGDKLT